MVDATIATATHPPRVLMLMTVDSTKPAHDSDNIDAEDADGNAIWMAGKSDSITVSISITTHPSTTTTIVTLAFSTNDRLDQRTVRHSMNHDSGRSAPPRPEGGESQFHMSCRSVVSIGIIPIRCGDEQLSER